MQVKLEQITPNAEQMIGAMASICYDSSKEPEACVKRAINCSKKGHLATMRFAHATFNVSGISRACSHQFVRSKHLDFLQRSQRYCDEADVDFVTPSNLSLEEAAIYTYAYQVAEASYLRLRELGIKKEDARFVLPEATHTELNVTGNLQAWQDFIKLRYNTAAQWEIREVAKQINNLLHKECPNLFGWIP